MNRAPDLGDVIARMHRRLEVVERRDPGVGGGGTSTPQHYRHYQSTAAKLWMVTHNLNMYPNVTAYDTEGREMACIVTHLDLNTLTAEFVANGVDFPINGHLDCS